MASEAKLRANAKYIGTLDRIVIQPKKETGAQIRQAAAEAGKSVQAFILDILMETMAKDPKED